MDIPVSRLNQRMALQLPAEFPLGLVFVVGVVDGLEHKEQGDEFGYFYLAEDTYRVRCLLSERASTETTFKDGDKIRAGGHLAFDPQKADYYLLARDIEMLTEVGPNKVTGSAIIADIDRRSQETGLVPAELPVWVKQLAPPELMAELGIKDPADLEETQEAELQAEENIADDSISIELRNDETMLTMSDELIDFLSMAMDSTEEIELTPEVIAHLGTPSDPEILLQGLKAVDEIDAAGVQGPESEATQPAEESEVGLNADGGESDIKVEVTSEQKNGTELDQPGRSSETWKPEGGDDAGVDFLAADLEMDDQAAIAMDKESSTPWPEIAVVVLIIASLILSFTVVYVFTSQ
jgi:hypothetical protein